MYELGPSPLDLGTSDPEEKDDNKETDQVTDNPSESSTSQRIDRDEQVSVLVKKFAEKLEDPKVRERLQRQLHTIDTIASLAEEMGLSNEVFLLGGFTSEQTATARPHDDIDLIVRGQDTFNQLIEVLQSKYGYQIADKPYLEHTSRRDLSPVPQANLEYVDIRWVMQEQRNGHEVWRYVAPEVDALLASQPLALPASAFSQPGELITPGSVGMRYIYPEYSYLTKQGSTQDKSIFDVAALREYVDDQRVSQIKREAYQANITLAIDEAKIAQIKKRFE